MASVLALLLLSSSTASDLASWYFSGSSSASKSLIIEKGADLNSMASLSLKFQTSSHRSLVASCTRAGICSPLSFVAFHALVL